MRPFIPLLALVIVTSPAAAQDPELRREAVRLLERAHAVSMSPDLPNLERSDSFRVLDVSTTAQEGTFTRVVIQGTGRRDEIKFGDYHLLNVWTRNGLATTRSKELAPAEPATVMWLTPIMLVSFDEKDVIRSIEDRKVEGAALRCIRFDTIAGEKTDKNEICVDATSGTLVSSKLGEDEIENSQFFVFAGALIPGKIRYALAGVPKLEITQTMTVLNDVTADVLVAPPDAQLRKLCTTWRRPIGESTPQPKPGTGGQDIDIEVRGLIGYDGKVHDAVVQSSARPDLNAEALSLVKQWVFTPPMCDGRPNQQEASFVVHFRNR